MLAVGSVFAATPLQTEHFRIMSFGGEVSESDLKKAASDLESVYKEVTELLGIKPSSSSKIEVCVYAKPKGGKDIRPSASAARLNIRAGDYETEFLKQGVGLLLINKHLPSSPRWFRQGLCQYIGYGDIRKHNMAVLPAPVDFSFRRLEADFGASKTEHDAYYYSWSVVSYLADTYGEDKLGKIFKESGSFSDKFSKAMGTTLSAIEKKAKEIFGKYKPRGR